MLSKLRRLADLPLIEQALLLQLTALSLGLRVALSCVPLHLIASFISRAASSSPLGRILTPHAHCATDRLVVLADMAAAVSHRNSRCLPRTLLLFWLLRARRQPVSICLGVSKNQTQLEGHAWVEQDGVLLGDTFSLVNRYALMFRWPA
ncbi:MAG: lasso peptide biosynthesis B2 protein [Nitrospira sp.]|nr:lasso peptide biosynthesis B2 protein [Nitrospira sp.]